ncbi:MAG: YHYH protein [Lentilitoribacter sp.]
MLKNKAGKFLTVIALGFAITPNFAQADEGVHTHDLIEHFLPDALTEAPAIVDCTLSNGSETKCLSLTINAQPAGFEIGPWCPSSIEDGPEKGGIWIKDGEVVDVDGAFIQSLPEIYNDSNWQLFNAETGKVRVTDTQVACEAAARPDVAEEYQNYCVECSVSYIPEGQTSTFVIPMEPVMRENIEPRISRGLPAGISFNGLRLDQSAPVDAILSAYTIAAFDDCGGHVNPHVGYHTHIVTDCQEAVESIEGETSIIGIAMDGFPILQPLSAADAKATELDECNGHFAEGIGYHYHAGEPASNKILPCHKGHTIKPERRP